MVFASIDFLFLFLPIFLLVYNFLPAGKNITYALFSLIFYFIGESWFVSIVIASIAWNYAFGLLIASQTNLVRKQLALTVGVSVNLLSLFFFKYVGFPKSLFPVAAGGWITSVHLPLGISFFTFHSISYLVDVYRRDAEPEFSVINLSLYILMFPQLIAGPILRFHTIAGQLKKRHVNMANVYNGVALFCFGMGQKVLIADTLAGVANPLFARWTTLSASTTWLASIAYSFQIYFDFSGYSNMAIGLGWLTGFHFSPNFNYPYVSRSITEFWQRWHISLSRWFRDYLYIPLGGNRHGDKRTYLNLVSVFFLCGLWHGAAWTFVLWGLYHGALLVLERLGLGRVMNRFFTPISHVYALCALVVGWVLFRSETTLQAGSMLSKMFFLSPSPEDLSVHQILSGEEMLTFTLAVAFSVPFTAILGMVIPLPHDPPWELIVSWRRYVFGFTVAFSVLILAGTKIITGAFSPFIYFRF